jgi:hypothetical protein
MNLVDLLQTSRRQVRGQTHASIGIGIGIGVRIDVGIPHIIGNLLDGCHGFVGSLIIFQVGGGTRRGEGGDRGRIFCCEGIKTRRATDG